MKTKAALLLLGLLIPVSLAGAAPNAPFDGYLVLDGEDDLAITNVSAPAGEERTIESFFLLEAGSNSPIDRLEIAATNNWTLYVVRYSMGGTRTGCVGYLGPGGWEHCRTSTIGLNVWHHLALVVKSGQGQFYLNGEAFGNPHSISVPELGGDLNVGSNLRGNLDELRVSDIARYSANFTIPSQKFTCDDKTLALWGFDEPEGFTTFSDRCGGSSLVGQNGAHSEGGAILAFKVYLPQVTK